MPQAAVFVDGGYLARILKDLGEPRIDYALLARWAAEGCDLFRTYYYDCLPYQGPNPSNEERQRAAARRRFDLQIGLDLASLVSRGRVDLVALVAGDSDLLPPVRRAQEDGALVRHIHGSKASYEQDLWDEADERRAVTDETVARMLLP